MNKIENPSKIRRICVYCGSGPGTDPAFVESGRAFGAILAKNGIGLVFGGGSIGMMGAIAKSVRDHGGEAIGVIPEFLVAREHAMRGTDNLIVTRDMHERKRKMFELADAFVAMPGGVGTLEARTRLGGLPGDLVALALVVALAAFLLAARRSSRSRGQAAAV